MKKLLVFVMAISFVLALAACGKAENSDQGAATTDAGQGPAQEIKLVATNFQFDQPEYKVKKGQPVKISLENSQGNHGAEIKEFGVNLMGGKSATFTPKDAGTYEIRCSVMCGGGHSNMVSKLIVE